MVFDTTIEDLPEEIGPERPRGRSNNPKTPIFEFLKNLEKEPKKAADGSALRFGIDKKIESQLLITVAPDGFLQRI